MPESTEKVAGYLVLSGEDLNVLAHEQSFDLPFVYFGLEVFAFTVSKSVVNLEVDRGLAGQPSSFILCWEAQRQGQKSSALFNYLERLAEAHRMAGSVDHLQVANDLSSLSIQGLQSPNADTLRYWPSYLQMWLTGWVGDFSLSATYGSAADISSLNPGLKLGHRLYMAQMISEQRPPRDPAKSRQNLDRALSEMRAIDDDPVATAHPAFHAWVKNSVGLVFSLLQDYEMASSHYLDARQIARNLDYAELQSLVTYNLAALFAEDLPAAAAVIFQSIDEQSIEPSYGGLFAYETGAALSRAGNLLEASRFFERALRFQDGPEHRLRILNQLAWLFVRSGFADRAAIYAEEANKISVQGNPDLVAQKNRVAAELALARGDSKDAVELLNAAMAVAVAPAQRRQLIGRSIELAIDANDLVGARKLLDELEELSLNDRSTASTLTLATLTNELNHRLSSPAKTQFLTNAAFETAHSIEGDYRAIKYLISAARLKLNQGDNQSSAALTNEALNLAVNQLNRNSSAWFEPKRNLELELLEVLLKSYSKVDSSILPEDVVTKIIELGRTFRSKSQGYEEDISQMSKKLAAALQSQDQNPASALEPIRLAFQTRSDANNAPSSSLSQQRVLEFDLGLVETQSTWFALKRNSDSKLHVEEIGDIEAVAKELSHTALDYQTSPVPLRVYLMGGLSGDELLTAAASAPIEFVLPGIHSTVASSKSNNVLLAGAPTKSQLNDLFPPIPQSERELDLLATFFRPEQVQVLKGSDFQILNLSKQLSDVRVAHFATHTYFNPLQPELSAMIMGDSENFLWSATEISSLRTAPELIVLSACEGAGQARHNNLGSQNLAKAFMAAGSKYVVANTLPAGDQASFEVMQRFYDKWLNQDLHPARAIYEAKKEVSKLNFGAWSDPSKWAGWNIFINVAASNP